MGFSHFFVDRPIFAAVLSVILTLLGAIAYRALPITEFPEIAPPTVEVTAQYPGASAEVLAQTVATPIEQEINGVDNMLYVISQSIGNGALSIQVVFKPGTNIDQAQVLVQNRVSVAVPRLPDQVQKFGVTVRKKSPDLMLVIHLISPDGTLDQQYISNYATVNIKDVLTRLDGVGDTLVFGARDFSMRIWLDPAKVQARGLTSDDVVAALRAANISVSAGAINQPPATSPGGFQIAVQTLGRLTSPDQFEAVVLVVIVIILFLQTWRAAIIPIVAIPVSLVGTFFVMGVFGFSLNNLTLFGLVLAIGIVVDDAIVVVENVERHLRDGLST